MSCQSEFWWAVRDQQNARMGYVFVASSPFVLCGPHYVTRFRSCDTYFPNRAWRRRRAHTCRSYLWVVDIDSHCAVCHFVLPCSSALKTLFFALMDVINGENDDDERITLLSRAKRTADDRDHVDRSTYDALLCSRTSTSPA